LVSFHHTIQNIPSHNTNNQSVHQYKQLTIHALFPRFLLADSHRLVLPWALAAPPFQKLTFFSVACPPGLLLGIRLAPGNPVAPGDPGCSWGSGLLLGIRLVGPGNPVGGSWESGWRVLGFRLDQGHKTTLTNSTHGKYTVAVCRSSPVSPFPRSCHFPVVIVSGV